MRTLRPSPWEKKNQLETGEEKKRKPKAKEKKEKENWRKLTRAA